MPTDPTDTARSADQDRVTDSAAPRRHVNADHQPDGTLCTQYDGMDRHYCHCSDRVSHRTLPREPATAASFAPLPDKGRPGEENAALDEIDAGGRWRAARRNTQTQQEEPMAGPYDDVFGTDTTPITISVTLPAREVALMYSRIAGYSGGVDYLGEYEKAATDVSDVARRILRDTFGEWVVNEWRAKHPEAADDKPDGGMG